MWRIFNTIQHQSLIGVDVSDTSIKILQLDHEHSIHAYGKSALPKGVVTDGVITDSEAFSDALNKILAHTKPQILRQDHTILRALIGLPESKIFTYRLTIPADVLSGNLARFIEEEVQKIIPLPLPDMYWDYHVLERGKVRNATFIGIRKEHLDIYIEAFSRADAKPIFVSGAFFALGSALLTKEDLKRPHMILDIGARASTVGIFEGDVYPSASVTIPIGGTAFTEAVMDALSLPKAEAEEAKHVHGVGTDKKDVRVASVLREILGRLMDEIQQAKDFHEKKMGASIKEITLSGGTALMPGLQAYIAERLGVPVRIGDPLKMVKNKEALGEDMPGIFFANVIGLASAARKADLSELNLLTQYRYEEGTAEKEGIALREARSYRELFYVLHSSFRRMSSRLVPLFRWRKRIRLPDLRVIGAVIFVFAALSFLLWVIGTYA